MRAFVKFLRVLGILSGLAAFGLALLASLAAGVDPLWALIRAVGCFAAMMVVFTGLSRVIVPLVAAMCRPDRLAAEEAPADQDLAA